MQKPSVPINYSEEHVLLIREVMQCQILDFLCAYLGLPLSIRKLPKASLQPLIDKIAKCPLAWKGRLLNRSGHLTLTKSTLRAIPVHISMAIAVSPWAIKVIETLLREFLWCGTDVSSGGKYVVA